MDYLIIERVGGLGGFGLPGSRVRSQGQQPLDLLSEEDRRIVDRLFADPEKYAENKSADGFLYRISREDAVGLTTIEVPESLVPEALRNSLRDELL